MAEPRPERKIIIIPAKKESPAGTGKETKSARRRLLPRIHR